MLKPFKLQGPIWKSNDTIRAYKPNERFFWSCSKSFLLSFPIDKEACEWVCDHYMFSTPKRTFTLLINQRTRLSIFQYLRTWSPYSLLILNIGLSLLATWTSLQAGKLNKDRYWLIDYCEPNSSCSSKPTLSMYITGREINLRSSRKRKSLKMPHQYLN